MTLDEFNALSPGNQAVVRQAMREAEQGGEIVLDIPSVTDKVTDDGSNGTTDVNTDAAGVGSKLGDSLGRKGVNMTTGLAMGQTGIGNIPGASSGIKGALNAAMRGASADEIGLAAAKSSTGSVVGQAIKSFMGVSPLSAVAASVGSSLAKEGFDPDPEYGATALQSSIPTAVGVAANMVMPGLGFVVGPLASYMTKQSLEDGWLGDIADSRFGEKDRDTLEELGFTTDQARYGHLSAEGWRSGATDAAGYGATPTETAKQELSRASGVSPTLGGYLDSIGDNDSSSGTDHDSSGGMGGGSDRDSEPGGMGGV